MVANLLLLGRVIRPNKARIDIVSVLRKVLDTKSDWFRASGMGLSATFGRHRIMVEGDEHQLEQVFVNLITNAQQAMSEGSVGETLAVEVGLVDDKAHLSFSDNGPGIESQDLPRIFDPFFSTREVGKGSGLGLSTCYQVISQHGGSIRAESVAGQGATITIELPVAEGPPYEATQQGFEAADAPSAGMGVLVVDDEQMVAEVIERTLSRQGYLVDIATGGSEVVSRTDLDSYDLILLDMKMPGLGGEEPLRAHAATSTRGRVKGRVRYRRYREHHHPGVYRADRQSRAGEAVYDRRANGGSTPVCGQGQERLMARWCRRPDSNLHGD